MYVIPAEGLMVPDPILLDHLPALGRDVTPSEYWTRRFLDRDVSKSPEAVAAALAKATLARDAARAARDAAKDARAALPKDAVEAIGAADAVLAAAEAALNGAEAIVTDIARHAPPTPKPAARAVAAPTKE
jgi:hypothetical protein